MELATGTVVKSHGVRGDLVVDVRTDSPEERFAVGTTITLRHTSGVTSHHEVTAARWHQGRLLVHLSDINDRTAAEKTQHLIPFVKAMVPEVDIAGGRLVVDLPEGLWDLS